jgi:hypothetical protein
MNPIAGQEGPGPRREHSRAAAAWTPWSLGACAPLRLLNRGFRPALRGAAGRRGHLRSLPHHARAGGGCLGGWASPLPQSSGAGPHCGSAAGHTSMQPSAPTRHRLVLSGAHSTHTHPSLVELATLPQPPAPPSESPHFQSSPRTTLDPSHTPFPASAAQRPSLPPAFAPASPVAVALLPLPAQAGVMIARVLGIGKRIQCSSVNQRFFRFNLSNQTPREALGSASGPGVSWPRATAGKMLSIFA